MIKKPQRTIALLAAVCLLFPLAGCGSKGVAAAGSPDNIKVYSVKEQNVTGTVTLTGVLAAEDSVTLASQLAGTVVSVPVKEGSVVKKGSTIISLDKRDLQAQLEQARTAVERSQAAVDQAKSQLALAQSQLDNVQKTYNRTQALFNAGAVSQQQLDQAKAQLDQAKTQLALAQSQYNAARKAGMDSANEGVKIIELNLAKTNIVSPINGIVATCSVSPGESVSPGVPLASVVSIDNLVLAGNLSENTVNYLKVGQRVEVTADVVPGKTFTGKVSFISPLSVTTGQFFPVKITINNPGHLLKAGMTGTASIKVQQQNALAVPNTAVFQRDGKRYVFVVRDGKAVKVPVKLGLQGEKFTSVLSGLKKGDVVIAEDTDKILEGDSIKHTVEMN